MAPHCLTLSETITHFSSGFLSTFPDLSMHTSLYQNPYPSLKTRVGVWTPRTRLIVCVHLFFIPKPGMLPSGLGRWHRRLWAKAALSVPTCTLEFSGFLGQLGWCVNGRVREKRARPRDLLVATGDPGILINSLLPFSEVNSLGFLELPPHISE